MTKLTTQNIGDEGFAAKMQQAMQRALAGIQASFQRHKKKAVAIGASATMMATLAGGPIKASGQEVRSNAAVSGAVAGTAVAGAVAGTAAVAGAHDHDHGAIPGAHGNEQHTEMKNGAGFATPQEYADAILDTFQQQGFGGRGLDAAKSYLRDLLNGIKELCDIYNCSLERLRQDGMDAIAEYFRGISDMLEKGEGMDLGSNGAWRSRAARGMGAVQSLHVDEASR
jgi:hypothetical protein